MDKINVDVEYCNKCGYYDKYKQLIKHVKEKHPDVNIIGYEGRRASFEIKINGSLVHSKLQTLAYPDYDDLCDIIEDAKSGKIPQRMCNQQPITSCTIA